MEFTARVPVLRVAVNVGNSLGSSGMGTNLAPTMTIGTGFAGRSSVGENLEPKHLLNWARIAYNSDPSFPMADFSGLTPWREHGTAVPAYPVASNDDRATGGVVRASVNGVNAEAPIAARVARTMGGNGNGSDEQFRAEIRRLVVEELSQLIKG